MVDVQTISNILSGVNWEELAGWLNIEQELIQEKCQSKLNGDKYQCYRKTLVEKCCKRFGNPEEVVKKIAQELAKMDNNLKAQQLKKLSFGECKMTKDSVMYFTLDIRWKIVYIARIIIFKN